MNSNVEYELASNAQGINKLHVAGWSKGSELPKTPVHDKHIVDPSPWPFLVSFSSCFFTLGLVLFCHRFKSGYGTDLFLGSILSTIFFTMLWWRDAVRESNYEGHHTFAVQAGIRIGMAFFLVSELMVFFAFFWALFHTSFNPGPDIGCVWPPKGIQTIDPWVVPFLNTGLLLTSGSALTWAHSCINAGYEELAAKGLRITIFLACVFTAVQYYEYVNAPFSISDGVYATVFFMLTGLHGFHVIIGTLFLVVAYLRSLRKHFKERTSRGFECAAWYWHFVDIVWIFLFLVVYMWS